MSTILLKGEEIMSNSDLIKFHFVLNPTNQLFSQGHVYEIKSQSLATKTGSEKYWNVGSQRVKRSLHIHKHNH